MAIRLFRMFVENQGGSLCCPSCGHNNLKRNGTLRGGSFPRQIFQCRKCGQDVCCDTKPSFHYGDRENLRSQIGKPMEGFTRLNNIPPWLVKKELSKTT